MQDFRNGTKKTTAPPKENGGVIDWKMCQSAAKPASSTRSCLSFESAWF